MLLSFHTENNIWISLLSFLIAFLCRICWGANDDLLVFNYTLIFTLSKINE